MRHALLLFVALSVAFGAAEADAKRRRRSAKKATLDLKSNIKGAQILVDDKVVGTTPSKQIAVAAGVHVIVVRKLGYLEFKRKVELKSGKTLKIKTDLLPFAGVLVIDANVDGAEVLVDGVSIGTAPLEHEVKLGSRNITVQAPGRKPWSKKITSGAGQTYQFRVELDEGDTAEAADDDLDLAALPLHRPQESDSSVASAEDGAEAGSGDELELEMPPVEQPASDDADLLSLESLPTTADDSLTLIAPNANTNLELTALPPAATKKIDPLTPWYLRWYVITGAAVAVAAAIIIPTVIVEVEGRRAVEGQVCGVPSWWSEPNGQGHTELTDKCYDPSTGIASFWIGIQSPHLRRR